MASKKLLSDVGAPLRGGERRALVRGDERPTALRGTACGFARAEGAEIFGRARRALGNGGTIAFRVAGTKKIAERVEGVVGDESGPDEFPERVASFAGKSATESGLNAGEKGRAARGEYGENLLGLFGERRLFGLQFRRREKKRKRFGEEEGDAAVTIADLFEANPDNFSGGHYGVEIAGAVISNAGGKNFAFEFRSEERGAL